MADTPLVSTKKCPSCQQWSEWQLQPSDRCTHCGQLLDPPAHHQAQQEAAAAHQKQKSPVRLIRINPEDGPALRFLKWIGRGGQLLFMAILGLLVWIATAVAA
ncbi:hypothetical protein QMK33_14850 [Hymenobacter sp. H14-R3]|uniref:hypothetical protein n=1 Tax=Hymenobacter sp. H14-R3 TaxID=3046308 RepID=UPI0024BB88D9|nr:hypothetical protein [Hymenobacter sp. H14-R3]MDJ0366435.1 hypothetical protein [Hymenobacter sp. H14-R3]